MSNEHIPGSHGDIVTSLRERIKDLQRSLDIAFEERDNAQKLADSRLSEIQELKSHMRQMHECLRLMAHGLEQFK